MTISFEQFKEDFGKMSGYELVKAVIENYSDGQLVLLSAFNPEDVILAKWISEIDPNIPILFLDTLKHFPETLRYVDEVIAQLQLSDVRTLTPDQQLLNNSDPTGLLWQTQVNRCCWLRKVEPIEREIKRAGFTLLLTGRRKEQTPERTDMSVIEQGEDGKIKINPLCDWTREYRDEVMDQLDLPHHPLYSLGYLSIGCAPCTTPIFAGEHEREGRWRHTKLSATNSDDQGKTECGLHINTDDLSQKEN